VFGEIWYGGYVRVLTPTVLPNIFGTVNADTGIFVFNPNSTPIGAWITVIDKKGNIVHQGPLYDGLLDVPPNLQPDPVIKPGGWAWITLGMTPIPASPDLATKYTFRLTFKQKPGAPVPKAPVVEIKEVIYTMEVSPIDILQPDFIKMWSETSLGGPSGTGWYPQ
jgi:hypothetical protein